MEQTITNKKLVGIKRAKKHSTSFGEVIICVIIALISLTCILPFLHVLAKSISSNTAVLSKSVYLIPKDVTFGAYQSILEDGKMTHSMILTIIVTLLFTEIGRAHV